MNQSDLAPSFEDVQAAARRLKGAAHRTPVMQSSTANQMTGAALFFKCENLQRIGAFKFRGAYNAIAKLDAKQRQRGVIAYSSGNHAQAIAKAGDMLGCPATIVMPEDAPPLKLAATRGYGANVVTYDRYTQNRETIANDIALENGLTIIPPYNHQDVLAGQGTAALELFEEVGELDVLLVCVGGGGLIAGCSLAAGELSKDCEVIGVEPLAGNDVQQSLETGSPVSIDVPKTIADGAQTQCVGSLTFPVIQKHVSSILTVTDESLVRTMKWFGERMKMVVEPTGCLAAAVALENHLPIKGKRVGVLISGGNVDMNRYASLIASLSV
ncbi:MAG: threo-3-hydroxy-L-aspartate ammonia-lyase [Burkholderiaceae bacterium]